MDCLGVSWIIDCLKVDSVSCREFHLSHLHLGLDSFRDVSLSEALDTEEDVNNYNGNKCQEINENNNTALLLLISIAIHITIHVSVVISHAVSIVLR